MNISGPQYSSSTVGLRQPTKLLDQHFKLVYIYPMLCDSSLTKYKELLRTFLSVSVLKEINISNSINFMNMGSNISPLVDDQGNVIDIDEHVISSIGGSGNSYSMDNPLKTKHDIQQNIKYDIQQNIADRTVYIQKLLNIDPKLKMYKPYLEMITMSNFIKMPIIVGTKCFDINKIVLLMILTVAVSDKKLSMTSYPDIQRIFRIIKQTNNNDLNSILNHLIDIPVKDVTRREKITKFFTNKLIPRSNSSAGRVRRTISNVTKRPASWVSTSLTSYGDRVERKRIGMSGPQSNLQDNDYDIINPSNNQLPELVDISDNSIDQASIFFKLCMDPDSMASQFGYNQSKGQLKDTFTRINPRINSVFENANTMFANNIWPLYIAPVLSSFLYTIVPRDSGINVSDIIIALQHGDSQTKIKGIFGPILHYITNDFKKELNNIMEKKGPDNADIALENLKQLCVHYFGPSTNYIEEMKNYIVGNALQGPDYRLAEHIAYEKTFEEIITKTAPQMHEIESAFKQILPNSLIDDLLVKQTSSIINDGLNSVITYFNTFQNYPASTAFFQYEQTNIDNTQISSYISNSKKQIIFFIRRYILYIIQYILCKYVNEVKVAVETTKHDVIDSNNYSLILPLETIMLLANAYAAKSYKNLYINAKHNSNSGSSNTVSTNDMSLIKNLNKNYVKAIIKFMSKQLDIPNLFVIDEMKGVLYYKVMYQSDVNKIKLSTIETYSKNVLNTYSNN